MINIKQLAIEAYKLPTTDEAIETVIRWAQNSDDHTLHLAIAALYKKFAPKVSAAKITPSQWVYKAAATPKMRRPDLMHANCITTGELAATDGHRMHIYKGFSGSPGTYGKNLETLERESYFPDYKRVLPNLDGYIEATCNMVDVSEGEKTKCFMLETVCGIKAKVNASYYIDAVRMAAKVYIKSQIDAIYFKSEDELYIALVMPLKY